MVDGRRQIGFILEEVLAFTESRKRKRVDRTVLESHNERN